jgi:pyrroloquinoline quinone biosynthesis protein B
LPQWNCACANCQDARSGVTPARTQSSVAIGDGQGRWFLVNASPDLRAQIESFHDLRPDPRSLRNTPIAGVLLTNPDLDHILGLFTLREGGPVNIYATDAVRQTLTRPIGLQAILQAFCGVNWHKVPESGFAPLPAYEQGQEGLNPRAAPPNPGGRRLRRDPTGKGLSYRAIILPGRAPPFAKRGFRADAHSVAYQFLDARTGGRLLVAPDVAQINEPLRQATEASEAVIFDGTFWSPGELARVKRGAATAAKMGHVPIHKGSLNLLAKSPARHKIYIHINNTNPILACRSPQRSEVEAAGIMVGQDGYAFEV